MWRELADIKLSKELRQSIDALGYSEPTEIQREVIPKVMESVDLVVKSQTGSGKTAAFGIPLVEKVVVEAMHLQGLILAPTRELAIQISEELMKIGRYKKVRVIPVYGKQPIYIQKEQLRQRTHIACGTPGRVRDLVLKGILKLDNIDTLVLDEADELLNRGFLEEIEFILKACNTHRQTLLFSATIPDTLEALIQTYLKEPEFIEGQIDEIPIESITQKYMTVMEDRKLENLRTILKKPFLSGMIFCNTQKMVDEVYAGLVKQLKSVGILHGGMQQKDRNRSIKAFKEAQFKYLVTTDLGARGLHIDNLEIVINYQLPIDPTNYIHRIGRTGRQGQVGIAVSFVSEEDQEQWAKILKLIDLEIPLVEIDELVPLNLVIPIEKEQVRDQSIVKIRINKGRSKKIRAFDIVGTICSIPGMTSEDIGIIDLRDSCTYVEIFHGKGEQVLKELATKTIKGKAITLKKIDK